MKAAANRIPKNNFQRRLTNNTITKMEYNLIQALMIHRGDYTIIFKSPICMGILLLSLFSAVFGYMRELKAKDRSEGKWTSQICLLHNP